MFFKSIVPIQYPDTETKVLYRLKNTNLFEHKEKKGKLILSRKRILPQRGIFRLLIPRVKTKIQTSPSEVIYRLKPDALAWVFIVILIGGLVTEITMDRVKFPRDYPAEFIYGLFVFFFALIIFELRKTKRVLDELIKVN